MTRVLLLSAYLWTCPGCGAENSTCRVPVELTAVERRRLDHALSRVAGFEISTQGRMFSAPPETVSCSCGLEFRTKTKEA